MSIKVHIMLKKICTSETDEKKPRFHCEKCDYSCNRKFLFDQHLRTRKHQNKNAQKMLKKICTPKLACKCGREYKHEQSLRRHQSQCRVVMGHGTITDKTDQTKEGEADDASAKECAELRTIVASLLKQNQEVITENSEMRNLVRDMLPKMGGGTTINNRFNINVFLNTECSNAVNLMDFVRGLPVDAASLSLTQRHGYAAGIANIFLQGLRSMDLHRRPIHCCDSKREVLYVRANDTWEKGSSSTAKMRDAISTITRKQISRVKEWEENHPEWRSSGEGSQQYVDLVQSVTGPSDEAGVEAENKIIRTIAREVSIGRDGPKDD